MKYEVIGWTYCGNDKYPSHEHITASVDAAIIKEIRKHKYLFGGDAHEDYCPVLNDGTYVSYSWRGWGRIIALAYGIEGERAYMCAYMNELINPVDRKYPEASDLTDDRRIVPKESLTETFVMHLADDMFEKIKAGTKTVEVRLFDDKRKQIDIGDYIEFVKQSDENEHVIRRVAYLHPYESFKDAFEHVDYVNKKRVEGLRFTPEQLGVPENSELQSLVGGMYKYYTKEQEKEHCVIAFTLEEPKHSCQTKFRIYTSGDEIDELYSNRLEQAANDAEFERLCNEMLDTELIGDALNEISDGFKRFYGSFEYGLNEEYDVDVNVMIRKTLGKLLGKEEKLKALTERFCVIMRLEVFTVIIMDSVQPKQSLTLDKGVTEFLHKSGVEFKLGTKVIKAKL